MDVKKKVCLIGAIGVGKTSLVRRFVSGLFDERYLATVGVKIDQKVVRVGGHDVAMLIWDISGDGAGTPLPPTYLRGLSGYFVVSDGTRPETVARAEELKKYVQDLTGSRLRVNVLNKADLMREWTVTPEQEARLAEGSELVVRTSAKTGGAVDLAFASMARRLLEEHPIGHASLASIP